MSCLIIPPHKMHLSSHVLYFNSMPTCCLSKSISLVFLNTNTRLFSKHLPLNRQVIDRYVYIDCIMINRKKHTALQNVTKFGIIFTHTLTGHFIIYRVELLYIPFLKTHHIKHFNKYKNHCSQTTLSVKTASYDIT